MRGKLGHTARESARASQLVSRNGATLPPSGVTVRGGAHRSLAHVFRRYSESRNRGDRYSRKGILIPEEWGMVFIFFGFAGIGSGLRPESASPLTRECGGECALAFAANSRITEDLSHSPNPELPLTAGACGINSSWASLGIAEDEKRVTRH